MKLDFKKMKRLRQTFLVILASIAFVTSGCHDPKEDARKERLVPINLAKHSDQSTRKVFQSEGYSLGLGKLSRIEGNKI